MFDVNKISGIVGIVGLRNPANPKYAIIDAANEGSTSGRYVTDNPFCKVEYIVDNFAFKDATSEQINTYLRNAQESAIKQVFDKVFNEPDFNDRQLIYQHAQNKVNLEELPDGFIGFELEVCQDKALVFEITRCILEFDVSEGSQDITLILWNSSSKLPLQIEVVNISSDIQEVELNWRLDNTGLTYKGKYYFGYLTQGLTIKPFKRDYESSNILSIIEGLDINEIHVAGHADDMSIFNLLNVQGSSINSGLNPDISVFDDYTSNILANKMLFAPAIEKQLTINLLQDMIASPRWNNTQRASKDMLTFITIELEGIDQEDGVKKTGLKRELMGDINHIRKEIRRMQQGMLVSGFVLNQR